MIKIASNLAQISKAAAQSGYTSGDDIGRTAAAGGLLGGIGGAAGGGLLGAGTGGVLGLIHEALKADQQKNYLKALLAGAGTGGLLGAGSGGILGIGLGVGGTAGALVGMDAGREGAKAQYNNMSAWDRLTGGKI